MSDVSTLKGFRDFLPPDMAIRNRVKRILIEVFESFGFEPLETPSLEYASVLLGKYGPEADKLVYTFEDKGERRVGLRYDLTVPLARVASTHSGELTQPFKRYQIQNVWRADKPQKGRYREFEQCDIDILNTQSPLADAEILAVISFALARLTIPNYKILLNSRPLLYSLMDAANIEDSQKIGVAISVDKLDKMTEEDVRKEIVEVRGVGNDKVTKLFDLAGMLAEKYPSGSVFVESPISSGYENIDHALLELQAIVSYAIRLGVDGNVLMPRFTLARGLDYYTGAIFETVVKSETEGAQFGSVTGGGRYDRLIKSLGGPDWPAVGTTIGLDRICDIIKEQNIWADIPKTTTQVLVTIFGKDEEHASISVAKLLRESGVNAELYFENQTKLDKQLKYADKKGIPWAIIIGPEEASAGTLVLKNLKSQTQETMPIADIAARIR